MRLLLIDTCGEMGSIALAHDDAIIALAQLPARTASAALLPTIQGALVQAGWTVDHLEGVGVISGPGSFTGVRVGLAAAKGLCEARSLPMTAVSRLEVLGQAAKLESGFAVLDAGRGELYVRRFGTVDDAEVLLTREELLAEAVGARVVVAEGRLMETLALLQPEVVDIEAAHALPLVQRALVGGANDVESADANYVRSEQQIYGKPSSAGQGACS